MSSPWSDIALRSQKAAGADDLLDADVWCLAGHPSLPCHTLSPSPYSESVDAVLDLIGEKFPEWSWRYEDAIGTATLVPDDFDPHKDTPVYDSGVCATPALALLAAFALAMEAQDGG